jgi:uncharacterized protein
MRPLAPLALALLLAGCGQPQQAAAPAANATASSPGPAAAPAPLLALTGRVVDAANLLTPAEEAALTRDLAALEARTTDQIAIATVPSLGGREIGAYGTALGNEWHLGQRGKDNGLIILVAPNERRAHIALGFGIERIVPDARAQAIMDGDMLPHFRRGEWHAGIRAGMEALIADLVAHEHEPRRGVT